MERVTTLLACSSRMRPSSESGRRRIVANMIWTLYCSTAHGSISSRPTMTMMEIIKMMMIMDGSVEKCVTSRAIWSSSGAERYRGSPPSRSFAQVIIREAALHAHCKREEQFTDTLLDDERQVDSSVGVRGKTGIIAFAHGRHLALFGKTTSHPSLRTHRLQVLGQ